MAASRPGRNCTTGPVFVDANVIVYRHDVRDPRKQARAEQWYQFLWTTRSARVGGQSLCRAGPHTGEGPGIAGVVNCADRGKQRTADESTDLSEESLPVGCARAVVEQARRRIGADRTAAPRVLDCFAGREAVMHP